MTEEQILATYENPDKAWAIRRISDHQLVAHGLWEAAVSQFDFLYAKTGEYYLDLLNKKAPDKGA